MRKILAAMILSAISLNVSASEIVQPLTLYCDDGHGNHVTYAPMYNTITVMGSPQPIDHYSQDSYIIKSPRDAKDTNDHFFSDGIMMTSIDYVSLDGSYNKIILMNEKGVWKVALFNAITSDLIVASKLECHKSEG